MGIENTNIETAPFASIPKRYDNHAVDALAVAESVGRRRTATRQANLGTFTGYRIGLDMGNGNIGWCILFERGRHLHFLTAEDIVAHNASLPKNQKRTQLPNLDDFVPLGTHKFDARENAKKGEKSYSKIRAEARSKRGLLDARQRRRLHVRRALENAKLLPQAGEVTDGNGNIPADALRVKLLDPHFVAKPHDLGRALYNVLKRRGYMKPVGRAGENEGSNFAKRITEAYRKALERYNCRTIGEFLECCAADARRDKERFRKRHSTLAWQDENRKLKPKEDTTPKSYEMFRFLTPTYELIREEALMLRDAQRSAVPITDDDWAKIEEAAGFRRSLEAKMPGRCSWFPEDEFRCVRALPSFQQFRILKQIADLRDSKGKPLRETDADRVRGILEEREKIGIAELSRELGVGKFSLENDEGQRSLVGAKTDIALSGIFGSAWQSLSIEDRDKWVMRLLRRHPVVDKKVEAWGSADTEALERDSAAAFGAGALERFDEDAAKAMEDKFASISLRAARVLVDCYERRLNHDERIEALFAAGAKKPKLELFERLPYYGRVMPDQTVPADGYAPPERTCADEKSYGRAANPDVHVVMNRLRVVVNAIIDMMGGILPTTCVVEVARSALSEDAANEHRKKSKKQENVRNAIVKEIDDLFRDLGKRRPIGPSLDRLVDRWKAAYRQGWRDYDGNEIPRSMLIDSAAYQLDHVSPAKFGDFRQNNLFVTRFNARKGSRMPWQAFGEDAAFRPALLAFASFGWNQRAETLRKVIKAITAKKKPDAKRIAILEGRLRDAEDMLRALEKLGSPRPDVLNALERSLKNKVPDDETDNDDMGKKGIPAPFSPGDQAALLCKFHPAMLPREGGFAARDVANIGYSTKLALQYLQHIGAQTVAIKPWAVHALRTMFDINKERADLRNHAVDAFLIAHFDPYVLIPAFNRLGEFSKNFEDMYTTRALEMALPGIDGGEGFFEVLCANLNGLKEVLPTIATAHRPDHRWNPGDPSGAGLGAFGKENIYSFHPSLEERKILTQIVNESDARLRDDQALTTEELRILAFSHPTDKARADLQKKLRDNVKLKYRSEKRTKAVHMGFESAYQLGAPGAPANAFINVENKFAIVAPSARGERKVLSVRDLINSSNGERKALFENSRSVYRAGDTVTHKGGAFVVTGLQSDARLTSYCVDESERDKALRKLIQIPARFKEQTVPKVKCDVLGRRLHRLRKNPGGLNPVPYPLRGQ